MYEAWSCPSLDLGSVKFFSAVARAQEPMKKQSSEEKKQKMSGLLICSRLPVCLSYSLRASQGAQAGVAQIGGVLVAEEVEVEAVIGLGS